MNFIRKLKQPCSENKQKKNKKKNTILTVCQLIFKTFPQYLTLYYIILLCMLLLQKPSNTEFYHTKKSFSPLASTLFLS